MALPGKEIHRSYDAYGPVQVFDDGNKRYLAFDSDDEQSCALKSNPALPQLDYVRNMLLVLLFTEPGRCISLGLGAGSLNTCLHSLYPGLKQQVVELRPAVIEAAQRYFQLPRSKRLEVLNMDAWDFLSGNTGRKADIVFSDIYSAEGLDSQQLEQSYLEHCHDALKADGWLVLNYWREHLGGDSLTLLKQLFADVRGCTNTDGNWVVFAGKQANTLSGRQLKNRARELSQPLGFSLQGYLSRLQQYR